MARIRCHWSKGWKLNHFWPSVHSRRSNNNCGRWLNWGGLNWTQSLKLNRSHPSENDVFDRIPRSDCSSGSPAQVLVLWGSFASSCLFVYASAVQCLNKSTEVEIFNLRGVFLFFFFRWGKWRSRDRGYIVENKQKAGRMTGSPDSLQPLRRILF